MSHLSTRRVLHVVASPRPDSLTRRLGDELIAAIGEGADVTVTVRDLVAAPLPPPSADAVTAMYLPPDRRTPEQQAAVAPLLALIDELRAADVVVISSPMYNFTVSAQLKAWIDHISAPGVTFRFLDSGLSEGLVADRPVFVVSASGSTYGDRDQHRDFHRPYLEQMLGFLGLDDVRWITAAGLAIDPTSIERAAERLHDEAAAFRAAA